MQIPLKIAIPLLILVPVVTWIVGTRKYDFVTPPASAGESLAPEYSEPVDPEVLASLNRKPEPEPLPEPPPPPVIEPGDFMVSPAIDEYRAEAEKGPASLLNLANTLLDQGQPLRALLAFERIIDSTPAGGPERLEAAPQLPALRDQLPPWNIDPSVSRALTIHLKTARPEEELATALGSVADLISVSSGQQAVLESTFTALPAPEVDLPSLPVMMWISVPGEEVESAALPVSTFAGTDENELQSNLIGALHEQLAQRVRSIPELTPPQDFPEDAHPATHFSQTFTLFMWQQILETPFQNISPAPGEATPSGNDAESGGELPPVGESEEISQDIGGEER